MTRSAPTAARTKPAGAATIEDLAAGVVMLTRLVTETVEIDDRRMEVWLKAGRRERSTPKQERHIGTGFLVADDRGVFLVTAAHVARTMDADAWMSFARRAGPRSTVRLRELLGGRVKRPRWVYPGDADAAVLRLRDVPRALAGHVLPAGMLEGPAAPPRDLELIAMGFPLGLFSESRFVAITMRAHAASVIMRLQGASMPGPAEFFLLDHPAMGGFSGGPVFVVPQIRLDGSGAMTTVGPRCVGLVSQTISDEKGAQFGLVTPSALIRRAVASATSPGRRARPRARSSRRRRSG